MKACPKCKSTSRHRMKRKTIVKIYPGSKSYACDMCNTNYSWFPFLNTSIRI